LLPRQWPIQINDKKDLRKEKIVNSRWKKELNTEGVTFSSLEDIA
jgi:hypothetical protein